MKGFDIQRLVEICISTSDADAGSEGQAYLLFQLHSSHLEDLACWQTPTTQHHAAPPTKKPRVSKTF